MKTTFVRLSVLALTFAGFAASSVVSYSQRLSSHGSKANTHIVIDMPAPCCPWNNPTGCM